MSLFLSGSLLSQNRHNSKKEKNKTRLKDYRPRKIDLFIIKIYQILRLAIMLCKINRKDIKKE